MALDAIDALRQDLPTLFEDRDVPTGLGDDFLIFSEEIDGGMLDELSDNEFFGGRLAPVDEWPVAETAFPGAPIALGRTPSPSSPPPPLDALAFYLPFHYFHPLWWGIYLTVEGVLWLSQDLRKRGVNCGVSPALWRRVAAWFLYGHEYFHHKSEVWAVRTELIRREPLYRNSYEDQFRLTADTDDWTEEAVATAYAYQFVKGRLNYRTKLSRRRRSCVLAALEGFINDSGPGYRVAAKMLASNEQLQGERELAEEYLKAAFPALPSASPAAWAAFPQAFTGISREASRVNYVIDRGSPLFNRLGLQGRFVARRTVQKMLKEKGCQLARHGAKHDVWRCPTGGIVLVPRHREISKGTAVGILEGAGLSLAWSDL